MQQALNIIGGRWRAVLVHALLDGPKRFSDLQKDLRISRRILIANLRALEESGIVSRTAFAEVPPRVEYALTPEGMELRPLINDLCSWGRKFQDRQKKNSVVPPIPLPVE